MFMTLNSKGERNSKINLVNIMFKWHSNAVENKGAIERAKNLCLVFMKVQFTVYLQLFTTLSKTRSTPILR